MNFMGLKLDGPDGLVIAGCVGWAILLHTAFGTPEWVALVSALGIGMLYLALRYERRRRDPGNVRTGNVEQFLNDLRSMDKPGGWGVHELTPPGIRMDPGTEWSEAEIVQWLNRHGESEPGGVYTHVITMPSTPERVIYFHRDRVDYGIMHIVSANVWLMMNQDSKLGWTEADAARRGLMYLAALVEPREKKAKNSRLPPHSA